MASGGIVCPKCGASAASDAFLCPACHSPLPGAGEELPDELTQGPSSEPRPDAGSPSRATRSRPSAGPRSAGTSPFGAELTRRLARLDQWEDNVESLGVEIPRLPGWAEEAARTAANPEPWAEVVRGIERIAQRRIVTAFEEWEKRTKGRLARLEAYSVDSRLERDQIEDALHTARSGDIAQALATYRQVDRVVAIKERHLDQAREELERVVSLLKDMQVLGVEPPQDPAESALELEAELRAGQARRSQAGDPLAPPPGGRPPQGEPPPLHHRVRRLPDRRADPRDRDGTRGDRARAGGTGFLPGPPEEGLRRLRALQETHGIPTVRARAAGTRTPR